MDPIHAVPQLSVLRQIHQQFSRRVVELVAGDVAVAARVLRVPEQTLARDLRGATGVGKIDKMA